MPERRARVRIRRSGELGGIAGHDTDDNAVEYWKIAKGKNALKSLSSEQRKHLVKDVLDGVTIGDDVKVVLDVLTTADGSMKETIDSVSWRRVWKKLWGDDCRTFIRACGRTYWSAASYEEKRAEVKWLADGRTNDIAQETIIIILRTCTSAEVSRLDKEVGGWLGLSFDLTGAWDDEFKKMKSGK